MVAYDVIIRVRVEDEVDAQTLDDLRTFARHGAVRALSAYKCQVVDELVRQLPDGADSWDAIPRPVQ